MAMRTLRAPAVPRKKLGKTRQLNVRVPTDLADRLEKTAEMLATDASHLLRLMLVEKLPEYEERARRARGLDKPPRS
jgi:hypothetical protein